MDATVLNVTGVEGVETGDVATFFGRDGEGEIPLEEVAGHAATINYEILTDLTPRAPRIWTVDGGY
jgi:alanine racemase